MMGDGLQMRLACSCVQQGLDTDCPASSGPLGQGGVEEVLGPDPWTRKHLRTLGRAAASGGKIGVDAGCAATAGAAGRARSACASNATARSLSRGQLTTARRQSSAASCKMRRGRAETALGLNLRTSPRKH